MVFILEIIFWLGKIDLSVNSPLFKVRRAQQFTKEKNSLHSLSEQLKQNKKRDGR